MMRLLAILLMLVLVGCKILGPDYKRAESSLPATFGEADDSANAANEVLKQWPKNWWAHYLDD